MERLRDPGESQQAVSCSFILSGHQKAHWGLRFVFLYSKSSTVCVRSHAFLRLKLKAIHRFTSTAAAVEEITALQEQKLSKPLKKFLSDEIAGKGKSKETLAVFDSILGAYDPKSSCSGQQS